MKNYRLPLLLGALGLLLILLAALAGADRRTTTVPVPTTTTTTTVPLATILDRLCGTACFPETIESLEHGQVVVGIRVDCDAEAVHCDDEGR